MNKKIYHSRSTPFSFEPPFRSNVNETYSLKSLPGSLKDHMEAGVKKNRPLLKILIKARNKIVKRFGIKTTFNESHEDRESNDPKSLYAPFKVIYHSTNKLSASYDDPHFNFYCELINDHEKDTLTCYSAVHFITPTGMIYFWSIYLVHVQVFKSFLKDL